MTIHRSRTVECDQCGRELTMFVSARLIKRYAMQCGWNIGRGNLADLCLYCVRQDHPLPTSERAS